LSEASKRMTFAEAPSETVIPVRVFFCVINPWEHGTRTEAPVERVYVEALDEALYSPILIGSVFRSISPVCRYCFAVL
jgi:hypothetical protein